MALYAANACWPPITMLVILPRSDGKPASCRLRAAIAFRPAAEALSLTAPERKAIAALSRQLAGFPSLRGKRAGRRAGVVDADLRALVRERDLQARHRLAKVL